MYHRNVQDDHGRHKCVDAGWGAMRRPTKNGTACAMAAKAADCALTGNINVPEPVELTCSPDISHGL